MLYVLLAALCYAGATLPHVSATRKCEPSNYLCSGSCPHPPKGLWLSESKSLCMKDAETEACVCWLQNPSSQLKSLFLCEALINGSVSQVMCQPPSHCFPAGPKPGCLIIPYCRCLRQEQNPGSDRSDWIPVRAFVKFAEKAHTDDYDGSTVEKVTGDIREFSLKHLLFLLGFVIAPLLCWCLLNFFHEGKCRKKPPRPPEPGSRASAADSSILEIGEDADPQSNHPCLPSAPENPESVVCAGAVTDPLTKFESPPPYCELPQDCCATDTGPPPSYEDAVQGSNLTVQQMWQTVFVIEPEPNENV